MIKKKRERNIRVDELSAISWKTRAPVHLARNNDRLPIAANVLDKNAVSLGRRFSAAIDRDQWRFKMSAKGISISMELRGRERERDLMYRLLFNDEKNFVRFSRMVKSLRAYLIRSSIIYNREDAKKMQSRE